MRANQHMLTAIVKQDPGYQVTRENWKEQVNSLEQMCREITEEEIYQYYPQK